VTRETPQFKLESTEHERKEVERIEAEKIAKQQRIVKICVDSLALPEGFATLEYPLALNYPTAIKVQRVAGPRGLVGRLSGNSKTDGWHESDSYAMLEICPRGNNKMVIIISLCL
jgi:hypothetical protein